VTVRLRSNWRGIDQELDRLDRLPDARTIAMLDSVLAAGFAATQAAVHVQTGSLKSSGDSHSEFLQATKEWKGEISYGGASLGPNNPVNYAIYEAARGIGGAGGASDAQGDHNFMAPLSASHLAYVKAMLKALNP
jgi:hypothetical protein